VYVRVSTSVYVRPTVFVLHGIFNTKQILYIFNYKLILLNVLKKLIFQNKNRIQLMLLIKKNVYTYTLVLTLLQTVLDVYLP
jgi:hypothetical protein